MKKDLTNLTKRYKTIGTILFCLACHYIYSQETNKDPQQYIPQPFIDKIELVFGPSLNIPNDHGWAEYYKKLFSGNDADEVKSKVGYSAGIGLSHTFSKRFELNARVLYERKGYKRDYTTLYSQLKIDYRYDYFTFTIQPRLQLGKAKKFHVFVGSSFGVLTQSKFEEMFFDNGQLVNINISAYDIYASKFDINICLGVGYTLNLGNKNNLLLQIQGNQGLLNIMNLNEKKITTQNILFSLAFTHGTKTFHEKIKTYNPKIL